MKYVFLLMMAAAVVVLLNSEQVEAQTNVVATSANLSLLRNSNNYAKGAGGEYYKYSTKAALPSQTQQTWTVGGTTYRDLTRVGDGQCVDFIKKVTNTTGTSASSWRKGADVVNSSGQIIPMPAGTAIATFVNGKYSSQHCMIVLTRVGNELECAEQNYLTGQDKAKIVSKRRVPLSSLRSYSIVQR